MLPARLSDRLLLLQRILPLAILGVAVIHQLGPARYIHDYFGDWAHYGLEIVFYGTAGPAVMFLTLRLVRIWVEQKERAEAEVYRLNRELQHRIDERTHLLQRIIEVQEEERKRIARELHDDFAQTLTALTINLETALQTLPPSMAPLKEHMIRVQDLTTMTLGQAHRWIQDLRPRVLDDLGLVPAIRWFAESRSEASGIQVQLDVSGFRWRLPIELETTLFRTIQEAINNVVKHAQARHVCIRLDFTGSRIIAEIRDDGIGFDPQVFLISPEGMRGIGLLGMRERVTLVGGQMTIDSRPGQGTHIQIEVPWTS